MLKVLGSKHSLCVEFSKTLTVSLVVNLSPAGEGGEGRGMAPHLSYTIDCISWLYNNRIPSSCSHWLWASLCFVPAVFRLVAGSFQYDGVLSPIHPHALSLSGNGVTGMSCKFVPNRAGGWCRILNLEDMRAPIRDG